MVEVHYIDGEYPLEKDLFEAAGHFNWGQIVAFPTDTVYALGCSLYNKEGIDRILKATGKEEKNQVVCTGQRHQIDCRLCATLLYTGLQGFERIQSGSGNIYSECQ